MKIVKIAALILGLLIMAMGLLWIGQGLNIIRWPAGAGGFMVGVPMWSWRGALLAGAGAVLIWFSRRR